MADRGPEEVEAPVATSDSQPANPSRHERQEPDPGRAARHPASLPTIVLMILAVGYTCVVAKSVLIPIAVAFILQALFAPLIQTARRRSVPQPVAAGVVVAGILGVLALSVTYLSEPAARWLEELPRTAARASHKLESWRGSMEEVRRATEEVEELTELGEPDAVLAVVEDEPGLLSTAIDEASSFLMSSVLTLTLLFLLLAHDGSFLRNLVEILPSLTQKKRAARIVLGFQAGISEYLRTVTLINLTLGTVLGLVFWGLGMPNPVLWGCMAAMLNYVPYLGTGVGIVTVGLVALLSFESSTYALLPPLSYLICSGLEGGVITPAIIGRTLLLSPAVILVWLVLWGWLWGIPGALIAVPLLMAVKILCEQVPSLQPVATMLSRSPGLAEPSLAKVEAS